MFVLKLPYATMYAPKKHSIGMNIEKYVIMNDFTGANNTHATAY